MPFTKQPPWRGGGGGGGSTRRRASDTDFQPMPVLGRLGPLSSGISTRKLPASSFDEIRKACDHYEKKCPSGGTAAARHLKGLANEVRTLVDALEQEHLQATTAQPHAGIASNRKFTEWQRCFGPGSGYDAADEDDPASVLGVSPEAVRKRLDAQMQDLERLRGEVADLKRKSAEERREFQAQVNAFGSAVRAAARQEGTVSSDKLALQQLRHEREMGRVHAHYQQQLEALNAQLLVEREQQQQRQQASAPARAQRRAARAGGGLEGTSSSAASFVDSDSAGTETTLPLPPPRFAPPRPPATAEEAAYLVRRLAEVQELFDVVRAATATTAAEARTTKKGPGAGAGEGAAAGSRAVPLGFDPFDPTFGGLDVYEGAEQQSQQAPQPVSNATARRFSKTKTARAAPTTSTPGNRTLRSSSLGREGATAVLHTPYSAYKRLEPALYTTASKRNALFTSTAPAMEGEGVREALGGVAFAAAAEEEEEEEEEEETKEEEGQWEEEEEEVYTEETGEGEEEEEWASGEEEEEEDEEDYYDD